MSDLAEVLARSLAMLEDSEEWPTNEALGGHSLLGTRDDEYYHGMREEATRHLSVIYPLIEAQVREQIARKIIAEQEGDTAQGSSEHSEGYWTGPHTALAFARGGN